MKYPSPDTTFPLKGNQTLCFLKNIIKNPNIQIGNYTYYHDFEDVHNFENNVKYHFDFIGDKLKIGKFCMIASDVEFIMNGGNHLSEAITSYPFAIFEGWEHAMEDKSYPGKGDTIIGNDVWIGYKAVIMPGVTVGDGAIIGSYALVTKDVAPFSIVGGSPAKEVKKRFTEEEIEGLLRVKWWDWPIEKVSEHVQDLTGTSLSDILK